MYFKIKAVIQLHLLVLQQTRGLKRGLNNGCLLRFFFFEMLSEDKCWGNQCDKNEEGILTGLVKRP